MSSDASLTILNVGHGNAAVLRDGKLVTIIDTGGRHAGGKLLDYLLAEGIDEVATLVLSHGDEDHIGSAATVLLCPHILVRRVFVNSDSTKATVAFRGLGVALRTARVEKNTLITTSLTIAQSRDIASDKVQLDVLYPPPEDVFFGPGAVGVDGSRQNTNSLSAAVRISFGGKGRVLLPADCGHQALKFWKKELLDSSADTVVFPHHGGRPGDDDVTSFVEAFTLATSPLIVVFSVHASKFDLPRVEVVDTIRRVSPSIRLVCTQLPERLVCDCGDSAWELHRHGDEVVRNVHVRVYLSTGQVCAVPDVNG